MTVTVKKIGGSMAVVIPRALAREIGLAEGTELDITSSDDTILMRRPDRRPRRSMGEIVSRIKAGGYRKNRVQLDRDRVLGGEVW
jgi:antitoxin component of MazEF toxin-antitoxin module